MASDQDPLTDLHVIQPAVVTPCKEPFPIPVELKTAKMPQGFGALWSPAPATTVAPLPHHGARRPRDNPRREHPIPFAQVLLGHHGKALVERAEEGAEGVSFARIALGSGR